MDNIGSISISARSQLCILTEDGEIIEQRIRTTPERFHGGAGRAPQNGNPAEASTESEWVLDTWRVSGMRSSSATRHSRR